MEVVVSVGGRFHAFNLAAELERQGYLKRLITSYPRSRAVPFGIPSGKVASVVIKEVLERGWRKLPVALRNLWDPQFAITEIFDRAASRRVVPADVFVGWANQSLHALRRAKELGAVTVLERGSSHILYQQNVLREEYEKFGVPITPYMLPHPKIVEKELREYEEADRIAIPSLYVKRTFLEAGIPERKLIHVPYGVDTSAFHPSPKEDDIFRVIFAGGLNLRKGVHYLLQAFAELALPQAELLLVGTLNDELRPFLKKYEGSYRHIGHVPQAELPRYYAQGSVFVLLSIEEGLAMVLPQAMACGLPVIATVNTGAEDIVRDGTDGFVIPIRDVAAAKEKLRYLYEHPDRCRSMGAAARERVAQGFTWRDYGERIARAYQALVPRGRATSHG